MHITVFKTKIQQLNAPFLLENIASNSVNTAQNWRLPFVWLLSHSNFYVTYYYHLTEDQKLGFTSYLHVYVCIHIYIYIKYIVELKLIGRTSKQQYQIWSITLCFVRFLPNLQMDTFTNILSQWLIFVVWQIVYMKME